MIGKKILVGLLLAIVTFTLVGCDLFNRETGTTEKTAAIVSISEVQKLEELFVDSGTEEPEVIELLNSERNMVDIVLSDGREKTAEAAWQGANGDFNSEEPDTYEFKGTARYNDLSTDISIDVVVDNNMVVDDRVTLTLEIIGEGEIIDQDNNVLLSSPENMKEIKYEPGTTLELTAVPHGDWLFMGWKGKEGFIELTEINMDQNHELQAVFGNILIFDIETNFSSIDWYVSGKLENLMSREIEYVEIHVELYVESDDKEDEPYASSYGVKVEVADGEIVNWIVGGFAFPKSDSYYKILLKNIHLAE